MEKKLILVAAPPACGKNYVSDLLCKSLGHVAYFDKDDLAPLLRRSFALCGEAVDMDGSFYLENLRSAEYETLMRFAFSALQYEDFVIVNAPFLREVRDAEYMKELKARAAEMDASLVLVWVQSSEAVRRERMQGRGSDRDIEKLADWERYAAGVDSGAPSALKALGVVDLLFVFDNENEEAAVESLREITKKLIKA